MTIIKHHGYIAVTVKGSEGFFYGTDPKEVLTRAYKHIHGFH